jgi:hypothetical protein
MNCFPFLDHIERRIIDFFYYFCGVKQFVKEEMYNPHFNFPEFEGIKNAAGMNRLINENDKKCL